MKAPAGMMMMTPRGAICGDTLVENRKLLPCSSSPPTPQTLSRLKLPVSEKVLRGSVETLKRLDSPLVTLACTGLLLGCPTTNVPTLTISGIPFSGFHALVFLLPVSWSHNVIKASS